MQISKSRIITLMDQGMKAKEIAIELQISPSVLKNACKHFDINLKKVIRKKYEFIDDTIVQEQEITEQLSMFAENPVQQIEEIIKETFVKEEEIIEIEVEEVVNKTYSSTEEESIW